ncbi:MAG: LysM peptidoglycan-binding domain-containing protein [Candidatus Saganbacteria bacterium]|nr:LysM peptidoglycan-binding domain-containing protein [Candidatus Saganbacteria bacterium]
MSEVFGLQIGDIILLPRLRTATSGTVTVQAGDTLAQIAKENYDLTSPGEAVRAANYIAQFNGLESADMIHPGQVLNLPTEDQLFNNICPLSSTGSSPRGSASVEEGAAPSAQADVCMTCPPSSVDTAGTY